MLPRPLTPNYSRVEVRQITASDVIGKEMGGDWFDGAQAHLGSAPICSTYELNASLDEGSWKREVILCAAACATWRRKMCWYGHNTSWTKLTLQPG